MMNRRLLLLNLVLLALVVLGVVRLRHDVQAFSAGHRVDQIRPESAKPLPKSAGAATTDAKQEWPAIAAQDPFSFDRNDIPQLVSPAAAQQPKRPKPFLYGTISFGKDPIAMLGPGDNSTRSSRPVHAGETFDGWSVVEIKDKTVVVKWDDLTETLITDPTAQATRTYEKTGGTTPPPPPVTSVGNVSTGGPVIASEPSTPSTPQAPTGSTPCKREVIRTPFGNKLSDCPSQ
jgi:hypothetical protein